MKEKTAPQVIDRFRDLNLIDEETDAQIVEDIEKYLSTQVEINKSIIDNIITDRLSKGLPITFTLQQLMSPNA